MITPGVDAQGQPIDPVKMQEHFEVTILSTLPIYSVIYAEIGFQVYDYILLNLDFKYQIKRYLLIFLLTELYLLFVFLLVLSDTFLDLT